jgi:hypothetical protein
LVDKPKKQVERKSYSVASKPRTTIVSEYKSKGVVHKASTAIQIYDDALCKFGHVLLNKPRVLLE